MRCFSDTLYQWNAESVTLRIDDCGESIFHDEDLHEYKFVKVSAIMYGTDTKRFT